MRLAHLGPDDLTDDQRAVYDVLTRGDRQAVHARLPADVGMTDAAGRLLGPFNAFLHHPRVGMALQELSRVLRFDGLLPGRARELVILVVAAAERSEFEWAAHAAIGHTLGFTDAELDTLAAGELPPLDDPVEAAAAELARSIVTAGDADDDVYERARAVLGDPGLVEVSTTVGVYRLLAQQMRLFRVNAPAGPWTTAD
ncbi:MAG: carboxymuconolactone decarboxylase family protein [Acidimicrobiales bacterium]|nr:carboxymuconolactone decarboxylase family protein [Acidimicrobiales bacterium]